MRKIEIQARCVVVLLATSATLLAQGPVGKRETVVTKASGGSIQTKLAANIVVNEESSVVREWLALHDSSMPADLVGTPGVTTAYVPSRASGDYQYQVKVSVQAKEALAAVEIRFLVFDVWGQHVRTLLADEVADIAAGATKELSHQWRVLSENEVSKHYASIGYISRLRTQDGRVLDADLTPVVREAQKFSKKFTAADLDPKDPK